MAVPCPDPTGSELPLIHLRVSLFPSAHTETLESVCHEAKLFASLYSPLYLPQGDDVQQRIEEFLGFHLCPSLRACTSASHDSPTAQLCHSIHASTVRTVANSRAEKPSSLLEAERVSPDAAPSYDEGRAGVLLHWLSAPQLHFYQVYGWAVARHWLYRWITAQHGEGNLRHATPLQRLPCGAVETRTRDPQHVYSVSHSRHGVALGCCRRAVAPPPPPPLGEAPLNACMGVDITESIGWLGAQNAAAVQAGLAQRSSWLPFSSAFSWQEWVELHGPKEEAPDGLARRELLFWLRFQRLWSLKESAIKAFAAERIVQQGAEEMGLDMCDVHFEKEQAERNSTGTVKTLLPEPRGWQSPLLEEAMDVVSLGAAGGLVSVPVHGATIRLESNHQQKAPLERGVEQTAGQAAKILRQHHCWCGAVLILSQSFGGADRAANAREQQTRRLPLSSIPVEALPTAVVVSVVFAVVDPLTTAAGLKPSSVPSSEDDCRSEPPNVLGSPRVRLSLRGPGEEGNFFTD